MMEKTTLEFGVVFPFLKTKKNVGRTGKLAEEKDEISEGIWDFNQAGKEKAARDAPQQRSQPA